MPKKTHKDQVFDQDGTLLSETERTEGDEEYVQRIVREVRAPAQGDKFRAALQDWDNADGTPNLFSSLPDRERDLLWEFCAHMRANADDEARDRAERITTMAQEFLDRGL